MMVLLDSEDEVNIETFDLIGFKGSELISSLVIFIQRNSLNNKHISKENLPEISHIGLAVHGKDMKPFMKNILKEFRGKINEREIYVLESTQSGTLFDRGRDVFKRSFFGVQLRSMKIIIKNYPGKIYWSSKLFETDENNYRKLAECIKEFNYKPYERSAKTLISSVFKCVKAKETEDSFFCSELVARCLQKSDILSSTVNPERVVPLDFYQDPNNPEITLDVDGEIPVLYENPNQIKLTVNSL